MSIFKYNPDGLEIETPFTEPEFEQKQSSDFDPFLELESPFVDGFDLTTHQNSLAAEQKRDESEIETFIDRDLDEVEFEEDEGVYFDSLYHSELSATPTATPGNFYKIQYGKGGLLTTAKKAYKTGSKGDRLRRAQRINNHPLNRKFWKKPDNAFERKHFPSGIINFNPLFTCGEEQSLAGKGQKKCFARIWIPIKEVYIHPKLGRAIDFPKSVLLALLQPTKSMSSANLELFEYETPSAASQKGVLKKVGNPTIIPYQFICSIITSFTHPTKKDIALTFGPATGTLIFHHSVLTAAHVLGGTWLDGKFHKADMVFVMPMHNSTSGVPEEYADDPESALLHAWKISKRPLGTFLASSYKIHPRYKKVGSSATNPIFDIAMIKLETSVGNLPWKGGRTVYWGSSRWGSNTILSSTSGRSLLANKTVNLSGYPTTKMPEHGINQWKGRGPVDNADMPIFMKTIEDGWMKLGYQIGAEDGHSGSPVFLTFKSGGKTIRKLVAVHTDGGHGIEASSGVLITPAALDWIRKSR